MRLVRTPLLLESSKTYRELKDLPVQGYTRYADRSRPPTGTIPVSGLTGHGTDSDIQRIGERAAQELNARSHETGVRVGANISRGAYGSVHKTDRPDRIVKFDTGRTEARLAQHMLDNPVLFDEIRSLPRYHSVHQTRLSFRNQPVWAIHREDIHDLPSRHHHDWDAFGVHVESARWRAEEKHDTDAAKHKDDPTFDHAANFHGHLKREMADALDRVHENFFAGKAHEEQFHRVRKDVEKLVNEGLVPCDMHGGNWGIRPKTGEVVMRDVGCFHVHDPRERARVSARTGR